MNEVVANLLYRIADKFSFKEVANYFLKLYVFLYERFYHTLV